LRAVFPVVALGTRLAAVFPSVTLSTYAGPVVWKTLCVVLASADIATAETVRVEGAGSSTLSSIPSHLALTLPSPRVAHFCVVFVAVARLGALRAVVASGAVPRGAGLATPAVLALAGTVGGVADGVSLTLALLRATHAPLALWTPVYALVSIESWLAVTLASDVVAVRVVEALTHLLAVLAPEPRRTAVSAHVSHPARGAVALSSLGVARASVLTAALVAALHPVGAFWAVLLTQRSSEASPTEALAGDVMTRRVVVTLALLLAILAKVAFVTLLLAFVPSVAGSALAPAVVRVTRGVVGAFALLVTRSSPQTRRTRYAAGRTSIALLTLADVWPDAGAVNAVVTAHRDATVPLAASVALATFLHRLRLHQGLILVNHPEADFVPRASRGDVDAPRVVSDLVG